MKVLKYIITLILPIVLFSCEKELDYKSLDYKPQFVLNGLIYQDSIIKINVATTKSILEADSVLPFLDNAEVKLYENNAFIENLLYDSLGMYHSTIRAKQNTSYRIEAIADNLETAIAKFSLNSPAAFQLTNLDYRLLDTVITIDSPVDTAMNLFLVTLKFDMAFIDNAEEENYYNFKSFGNFYSLTRHYASETVSGHSVSLEKRNSVHLGFRDYHDYKRYYPGDGSSFNGYERNSYIPDILFNGKMVTFNLATLPFYMKSLEPIDIILYSFPFDYIHFHNTGYRYVSNNFSAFSQPINIHSNIENGLGIVCAVSCNKQKIDLSEFIINS